jgi:hypothetical protein
MLFTYSLYTCLISHSLVLPLLCYSNHVSLCNHSRKLFKPDVDHNSKSVAIREKIANWDYGSLVQIIRRSGLKL